MPVFQTRKDEVDAVCQPENILGHKRTADVGMAVVETTVAAVVAAAAAPVGKTATARMMMMLTAATAVQAG